MEQAQSRMEKPKRKGFINRIVDSLFGKKPTAQYTNYSHEGHRIVSAGLNEREKKEVYEDIQLRIRNLISFTSKSLKKNWDELPAYQRENEDFTFENRILKNLTDLKIKIVQQGTNLNDEQKKHIRLYLDDLAKDLSQMAELQLDPHRYGKLKGGNNVFNPHNMKSAIKTMNICLQNMK